MQTRSITVNQDPDAETLSRSGNSQITAITNGNVVCPLETC